MTVNLTTEQFSALLNNVNVAPKRKTKSLINDYKDAMDIEDFITNLKYLNVSRLANMSLIDFVVETVKMNLDPIEERDFPFVCANYQKRLFYYKTKGEWKKGMEFIKMIHSKISKQAYKELVDDYTEMYKDDLDVEDDELISKRYDGSKHATKQQIIMNLCHIDKYSFEKLFDRILAKLGKLLKNSFDIVNE